MSQSEKAIEQLRRLKRRVSRFFLITVILFVVVGSHVYWLPPCARMAAQLLVREDQMSAPVDFAVVLAGAPVYRARRGVDLILKGQTKKLLLVLTEDHELVHMGLMPGETEITKMLLRHYGVPDEAVVVIGDKPATSTKEEAEIIRAYLDKSGVPSEKFIVVTSWYHTRRAGWIFNRIFDSSPYSFWVTGALHDQQGPNSWWRKESSFLAVFGEFLKWPYYLYNY